MFYPFSQVWFGQVGQKGYGYGHTSPLTICCNFFQNWKILSILQMDFWVVGVAVSIGGVECLHFQSSTPPQIITVVTVVVITIITVPMFKNKVLKFWLGKHFSTWQIIWRTKKETHISPCSSESTCNILAKSQNFKQFQSGHF